MSVAMMPQLTNQPTGYGALTTVGPASEPIRTSGTIFDENDTYPGDINSGPSGTTYLMRASGSPYGSSSSVLTPPTGTRIFPYNGEAVTLNGRWAPTTSDNQIGGMTMSGISSASTHVLDVRKTTSGTLTDFVIRGMIVNSGSAKHVISFIGNIDGFKVFNNDARRTNETYSSGDPSEYWVQNSSSYRPTNGWFSNNIARSRSGGSNGDGTNDALQLQYVGKIHVEYHTFVGNGGTNPNPRENWTDLKNSVIDDYSFHRCRYPDNLPPEGGTFISRANCLMTEVMYEDDCRLEIGVNGQGTHIDDFEVQRCLFLNGSSRQVAVQETDESRIFHTLFTGGQFRVISDGTAEIARNNIFQTELSNEGSVTCANNKIVGGSGWSGCTGTQ